jgi:glycosyltransferase involved in cell wall biosynthesis
MSSQKLQPDLWIVVDNSTTPAEDWSVAKDYPNVLYERVYTPRPIGWLRNLCLKLAIENGADYIVFWDDDDYYPPTRISSGVEALEKDPKADISGSSKMYILLTQQNVLMTTGPFHDAHATAATWTIRRSYAETHTFDPEKSKAEEVTFTNGWKANMVQVNPDDMIVVMGHRRNTVDKSQLADTPNLYRAQFVNSDNGKFAFRVRWPVQWDLWKQTFSDGGCAPPPENNSLETVPTAEVPIPRTEETGESVEHHA